MGSNAHPRSLQSLDHPAPIYPRGVSIPNGSFCEDRTQPAFPFSEKKADADAWACSTPPNLWFAQTLGQANINLTHGSLVILVILVILGIADRAF